jgi:mannosylglycoprotein endo-beta-mannosidase
MLGFISLEQFRFLERRQIHEAIWFSHEGIHSIRVNKLLLMVLKLDLSKAYDRTCSIYLILLLIHIEFSLPVVNWIIGCVTTISFVVLIDGASSPFFKPSEILWHGCPLSPYLSLLVVNGLSKAILEAKWLGSLKGVKIWEREHITHMFLIDGVLLFTNGYVDEGRYLKEILQLYSNATRMEINLYTSSKSF